MSAGWDPGGITQAVKLVHKIIKSVSSIGGARDDFQELQSELRGLLRALNEISDLTKQPGQLPEIVALKFAACLCEDTLKNFFGKIAPFDESLRGDSQLSKLKAAPKMVRWELLVKTNVPEFRSYLVAHVGSLNLRLNTTLLRLGSKSLVNQVQNQAILKQSVEDSYSKLDTQANDIFTKIKANTQEDTIPKLNSLLDLASSVWLIQNAMVQMFEKAVDTLPSPNLRYTWAQAPLKFEDALGRVIPVPSEYDWDKLEAIIQAQFKTGPGQAKVRSGEYELFTGMTSLIPLKAQNFHPIPGMTITMTFIIGQYIGSERCPRVGCRSQSFTQAFTTEMEVKICLECQTWFRKSKCVLAKPMKPVTHEPSLRDFKEVIHREYSKATATYEDRMSYKNISIYVTELPPTPKVFRDKYHRKSTPSKSTHKVMPPIKPAAENKSNVPTFGVTQNTDYTWSRRPQTYQMTAIPKIHITSRPCTLGFEITSAETPRGKQQDKIAQLEAILEDAAVAALDADFKDELYAIEQWFRVLSEAERTATLYAFLQQVTMDKIEFFASTLEVMGSPRSKALFQ